MGIGAAAPVPLPCSLCCHHSNNDVGSKLTPISINNIVCVEALQINPTIPVSLEGGGVGRGAVCLQPLVASCGFMDIKAAAN